MATIVDLEATCWEDKERQRKNSEIIEIGAVKDTGEEFQSFVKPIIEPQLSDYCKNLTKITQEDVYKADTFDKVIKKFQEFIGNDTIYSWGDYDKNQLIKDCGRWRVDWLFNHVNLKQCFAKFYKIKKCGVIRALEKKGLKFEGNHHRALDDARNILRLYNILKEESINDQNFCST